MMIITESELTIMIRDIIQMSYLVVIGDITLMFFIIFNSVFTFKRKAAFLTGCIVSLLMVVCNMIMYSLQETGQYRILLKAATAVSYAISGPVILPLISLSSVIEKKIRSVLIICACINAALSFISIANGCIFSYTEAGKFVLGRLSPIPFYLSAMYLAVMFAASVKKFRIGFRSESVFLGILTLGIVSAVVLNTAFNFKYLISGMAVLSCIFYYLFFTTQTLTRDALTNALNRHSFYKDLGTMKKHQMIIVSMDLNGLKQINDQIGHDAGDQAILTVARCSFDILPARCRLYRMGGDEFEILCPQMSLEEAADTVEKIKAAVTAAGYSVAAGLGEYKKDMDFDELFSTVDEMMYTDKRSMKAAGN